jgi:hypothetical protein
MRLVALFVHEENTHHAERISRLAQEQEVHGQRDCYRHWDFNASRRLSVVRQDKAQRIDAERFQPANRLRGEAMMHPQFFAESLRMLPLRVWREAVLQGVRSCAREGGIMISNRERKEWEQSFKTAIVMACLLAVPVIAALYMLYEKGVGQ